MPPSFYEDVEIDPHDFHAINLKKGVLLLLESFRGWDYEKMIVPYSGLYVDVEKYYDEDKEAMSCYGMCAIYAKDIYGCPLHKKGEGFMEEKAYYDAHREALFKDMRYKARCFDPGESWAILVQGEYWQ